jgi:pyruvate/2-oxoglutarate dehydrogenase complex dihydrolipoamide dehydrogenase (E3) component
LDADAAQALQRTFEREGIRIYTGAKLQGASQDRRGRGIDFLHHHKRKRVHAETILYALGRTPATTGLGLEKIGVETDNGRIVTNKRMQSSVPHIYAAGDCTGPHQIVHIGVEQGEVAARNIARPDGQQYMDYRLLCTVVFTDPQVAVVGLTEQRARARNIPYIAAAHPFNDHGKAMIMGTKQGFVKLLANPATGEILGGACVGPIGGELIHEIIAAMHGRMTVGELAALPHYHPTLAEIWTYPAAELAQKIK